jgi:hypothetical protein
MGFSLAVITTSSTPFELEKTGGSRSSLASDANDKDVAKSAIATTHRLFRDDFTAALHWRKTTLDFKGPLLCE